MLWVYLLLAVLQCLIAYVTYKAFSYNVVSGEEMFEHYICCGRLTPCSKEIASFKDDEGNFYISGTEPFLDQYRFRLGKFWEVVLILFPFVFMCPLFLEFFSRGPSIFFLISCFCLTILSHVSVVMVKKRCDEEEKVFLKLVNNRESRIPGFLPLSSIEKIRSIIIHDCYAHAKTWLTQEELELLQSKRNAFRYYTLVDIIEHGFSLSQYGYCPALGKRDVKSIGNYNGTAEER